MEDSTPAAAASVERMRSLRRRFLINGTTAVVGTAGTARVDSSAQLSQ